MRMMMKRSKVTGGAFALLLLLLLAVAGCAGPGVSHHDPMEDFGSIKTVAVLPFANLSKEDAAAPRVRDPFCPMLLATGGHQGARRLSMARHGLGVPAISLTGPQAGITTDGRYGRARIAGIEPRRVHAEPVLTPAPPVPRPVPWAGQAPSPRRLVRS